MVNVLDACIRAGVGELILASSSEVYQTPPYVPTDESVPLSVPDPYNPRYSYAGGKIISELMAIHYGREYFKRVVIFRPHNVFGPNMGWDHVIPQFVTRLQQLKAKATGPEIPFPIQGKGDQTRAFIYVEDFISGLMLVINGGSHLNTYNIGTTAEITVRDVADKVAHCVGVSILIVPGPEAAGGTPRRCPDISKLLQLGFQPRFTLDEALPLTVQWYVEHPEPIHAAHAMSEVKLFLKET
jgi:nucleoside-diphosphate-sugar epimerase